MKMVGNRNSGRRSIFNNPIDVRFQMEKEDVDKLNAIAEKYTKNNRSELIMKTLKKMIDKYESR